MKILYLCFDFSVLGGLQAHNKAFFDALQASGNPVKLVTLRKSSPLGKFSFIIRVMGSLLTSRPELIITGHVNFSPLCVVAKKFFKTKYVVIAHGIDVWGLKSASKLNALRNADAIVSVSHYTSNRVRAEIEGVRGKLVVIPNTVDTERFTIRKKSETLLTAHALQGKKIILTVARLSTEEGYKGYDKIIDALPAILKEIPNAHYLIVGDGSDRKRMEAFMRERNLGAHVTFAGRVSDELLPDYYNLADVFAMPSKGEGFGIVFIEAAACGIPIIAGNQDGSVDATLNGELGLLINPDSIEEIENAIIKVLNGGAKANFYDKEALREKAIAAFGADSFKKKIIELIGQLASTNK